MGGRPRVLSLRERRAGVAVVTNRRRVSCTRGLRRLGLDHCFEHLVCWDDVAKPKPDAEPVLRALDALRVRPIAPSSSATASTISTRGERRASG
jgi:beta-phosphoglucomutase-like phosphatase (HAD superfamily)